MHIPSGQPMSALSSARSAQSGKPRVASVAGQFYPGEAAALLRTVDGLLSQASRHGIARDLPKALIVPHAGYQYSGPVAASAYCSLSQRPGVHISRVVLLGPAHRVPVDGIAASGAACFETPLGEVPVDRKVVSDLAAKFNSVEIDNLAHRDEHSLETQLPFLQRSLGSFSLVPLVVGRASPELVADCLEYLWGQSETLVVVSTDLSHYHPYAVARRLDEATSNAIVHLDPSPITSENACGGVAVRGLLQIARKYKLRARALDVRNSGDTTGRFDQVVGYGSYAFLETRSRFDQAQREATTQVAWQSIDTALETGRRWFPELADYPPELVEPGTCFVTLHNAGGSLRGCIGTLKSEMPLLSNVAQNARMAAFEDSRFPPLAADEREQLRLEVSVLGPRERLPGKSEAEIRSLISPFVDGLVLRAGSRRATFLPAVWRSLQDTNQFLQQLKRKAGLGETEWSPDFEVYRFTTESW